MGDAAAFDASDYKALVCVFFYGGNDYANTVVTYDEPSYNAYSTIGGGGAGQTAGVCSIPPRRCRAGGSTPCTPPWVGWQMAGILPNLSRFDTAAGRADYPTNLGFMG